jgi:lon-related putative ATP-dependent protease
MSEATLRCELSPADIRFQVDPDRFGFATTAELEPLEEIVGQPRALEALDLGVGIRHRDYHVYAAGMTGTSKLELLKQAVQERVAGDTPPDDWVYVNNFDEPDRPHAIRLGPGQGVQLREEMEQLIETLVESIPKAFRDEDFSKEKERLREQYKQRAEESFKELEQQAGERDMAVRQLPEGELAFIPLKEGRPMTQEEVQELTPEQMKEWEERQEALFKTAAKVLEGQQEIRMELARDVRHVARSFADQLVGPLVKRIADKFDNEHVRMWLERLQQHVVEHLDQFRPDGSSEENQLRALLEGRDRSAREPFLEYRVNVVVDNSEREGPPVIIESAPNYKNILGTVERVVDRLGRVQTNFTRIKAGSLLRANGGVLVFDLMDALSEPLVWRDLKRTLKAGQLEIDVYDPLSMFTVSAIKPEPIPLNVKLVVAGPSLVYYLLSLYDEDFSLLFRVKADFDTEVDRDQEAGRLYGRFVRKLADAEGIHPFTADGVGALVRIGARFAGDRDKLSTLFTDVADMAREADFWARKAGDEQVTAAHVRTAREKRVFRSNLIAEKIRELIREDTLLIDTAGTMVGKINGLSVANLGDYAFGRPSRITASVGIGAAGIVNIERESRLSGHTYDKGLLILEGYLRNTYAQKQPLTLSASIAMEQSYGGIDGDSASVAELLVLLSAIAGVPLRQDVAVTGSINQWGEVQAIGGVNEKVEGFFDVCRERELTGTQGVCIPRSNVQNLVLRPDVLEAVEAGRFRLWAVERFDETIELFSGLTPGSVDDPKSFHGKVNKRLAEMLETLKKKPVTGPPPSLWIPEQPAPQPDPRPPLPGED